MEDVNVKVDKGSSLHENAKQQVEECAGSEELEATEKSKDTRELFSVDTSAIQTVPEAEQDEELKELGISVFDQATFEQGVMEQVDRALEKQKKEDSLRFAKKELASVRDDIRLSEQKLHRHHSAVRVLTTSTSQATAEKISSMKEEVKKQETSLKELKDKAAALESQIKSTEQEDEKGSTENSKVESEVEFLFPAAKEEIPEETEKERMVRCGEMTPFGTLLRSLLKKPEPSTSEVDSKPKEQHPTKSKLTDFERYMLSQANLQTKRRLTQMAKPKPKEPKVDVRHEEKEDKGKHEETVKEHKDNKYKSALKLNILHPKKKKYKKKLGTVSSDEPWDHMKSCGKTPAERESVNLEESGSEYFPSESELSSDEKKKKKKGRMYSDDSEERVPSKQKSKRAGKRKRHVKYVDNSSEWGSDDSDWDYSDEERDKKRRKARRARREIDDGNLDDYLERIEFWKEDRHKRRQEREDMGEDPESEDENGYEEFEFGLRVPLKVWNKLYNYQRVGVRWIWELHQQQCGGILGDEMGLGKTLQVIAFLAGLSYSKVEAYKGGGFGPTLIVCPTTVMSQWVKEFHRWWPPFRVGILHESGGFSGSRSALVRTIFNAQGILVVSYTGVVQHKDALLSLDWQYVVLDEGHKIRNPEAQATLVVKQFNTSHRLILSGSPLQNNLKELWSLFDFIFPGKLGTLAVFLAEFAVPITEGGYANATQVQVATAYKCATVLRDTISPYLLRRMKADVQSHLKLPTKNEQVLFCRLTEDQRVLYKSYLDSGEVVRILDGRLQIFVGLINLRKICNHPDLYSGGPKLFKGDKEEDLSIEDRYGYWEKSGKMIVVDSLLKIWNQQKHRVLLFTQSRQMLCILENFVQQKGYTYIKLDGGTSVGARQPMINKFNEDTSIFVFLLTTRVGGLGINLTGADRVIIFDPDWNPATDLQARERAWRIGQQSHVTVYRLVTAGTIEEKIYHRQIFKQFLTNRVLKDPRQRRFFKANDLFELFTLKEGEKNGTETAAIFAGTGSEVKPRSVRKPRVNGELRKSDVRVKKPFKESRAFSDSNVVKDGEYSGGKTMVDKKPPCDEPDSERATATASSFSEKKLEAMKRLAQQLSQKIAQKSSTEPSASTVENVTKHNLKNNSTNELREQDKNVKWKKRKRKETKKSKRRHGSLFEGERVSHLVRQREYKAPVSEDDEEQKPSTSQNHDDYVLRKLFSKSGLQTALCHDVIMEGGEADYALVEGEAERVAREAVKALKASRRECFRPKAPGTETPPKQVKPRFGQKKNPRLLPLSQAGSSASKQSHAESTSLKEHPGISSSKENLPRLASSKDNLPGISSSKDNLHGIGSSEGNIPDSNSSKSSCSKLFSGSTLSCEETLTSGDILKRIRERNALVEVARSGGVTLPESGSEDEEEQEDSHLPKPEVTEEHAELLSEIRNFIAFRGVCDGQATTEEIVEQFQHQLPNGTTPLFRSMLYHICSFHRDFSGVGVWRLRSAFR